MIKIDFLLPTDYPRIQELLAHEEQAPCGALPSQLPYRGLTFWQHWLPCNWHLFPSAYVAREDGAVIGLIVLSSMGRSRSCWRIDHLVVHPDHRGRGLAAELLRYVFALFGGQGISHFVAYTADENSAALRLFGSCGFKRAAKLTVFNSGNVAGLGSGASTGGVPTNALHNATAADSRGLFQLFQDVLPPDIRIVFAYVPEDFAIVDSAKYNRIRQKFSGLQTEYWLWQDEQRQVVTSAVKVNSDRQGNARLEFAVHPGWRHQAGDFVRACLQQLKHSFGLKNVVACVFDFDSPVAEALQSNGMESAGHFCLLTREHWVRAKKVKRASVGVPAIAKPAINFPI